MERITTLQEHSSEPNPSIRVISRAIGIESASADLSMPLIVQLIANGVELPFAATCDSLWKSWQEAAQRDVEKRARDLAQQMVLGIGMAKLTEALNTAGNIVAHAVDDIAAKVGGEDIAWEPQSNEIIALRHAKLSSEVALDLRQKWEHVFGDLRTFAYPEVAPSMDMVDQKTLQAFADFDKTLRAALPLHAMDIESEE